MSAYFLELQGIQKGPYSLTDLMMMWKSESITMETLHWHEELSEWTPIGFFVEEEIERIRDSDQRKLARAFRPSVEKSPQTESIGAGENLAIIVGSLLFTPLTFLAGIIYAVAGQQARGVRLMAWSLGWVAVWSLFGFFVGNPWVN